VVLKETAAASGIKFRHRHGGTGKMYFVETTGAGACFFDYDNDGAPDLYLVQSGTLPGRSGFGGRANRSALYRNEGNGRFTDVTDRAGVQNFRYGQGACAGDYDADGDLDLYVTNFGENRLFRNNGDGTFSDVTKAAGTASSGYHTSAAFADVDGDGDLDLYVCRYADYTIGTDPFCSLAPGVHSYCQPAQFPGIADVLYRNNGDGAFTDVTTAAGVSDPVGRGLGVVFVDYDDDGKPDLYVANDGTLNRLYRNLGGGRFEDVTTLAGVGSSEDGHLAAGMGVDAGDYDGDSRFDLFVANFSAETNDLYRNRGDGAFDFRTAQTGLGEPSLMYSGFGAAFVDYDLDGWLDVMVANGHVEPEIAKSSPGVTYAEPKSLYRNLGGKAFQDVSRLVGPDWMKPAVSRGLALADIDGDGDPDAAASNSDGAAQLFRNDGADRNRWVAIRLKAAKGDPFGVGAKVTVEAEGRRQVREVRAGSSYCSQHDLTLLFGLGAAAKADRVTVRWPWRGTQEWKDVAADQVHLLKEAGAG
jgi:enediyne biosynthesis protein E4